MRSNLVQQDDGIWKDIHALISQAAPPGGMVLATDPTQRKSLLDLVTQPESEDARNDRETHAQPSALFELANVLRQLEHFCVTSRAPIVGITGMLNAGKSSLLATFLSPASRQLVPRGAGNNSGTHRFVLWLPTRWREEEELLDVVRNLIAELFGTPPDTLSSDPAEAAKQYTGAATSSLAPLLAFDTGLDSLELGLLDCPDLQSGFQSSTVTSDDLPSSRHQQLAAIGRLCSAFITVGRIADLHDDRFVSLLQLLRETMPGVARIFAINRVKARYSFDTVVQETKQLADRFGIDATYVAYDYRSSRTKNLIPQYPSTLVRGTPDEEHPIFFRRNAAGSVEYLQDLSQHLDAGRLVRESSRSLWMQLKEHASRISAWLDESSNRNAATCSVGWNAIGNAAHDFMSDRSSDGGVSQLRLQTSPAIVSQIADSLQRTAPAWMRASLRIDKFARSFQQKVVDAASSLKILGTAGRNVKQLARRLKSGAAEIVTPARMSEAIRSWDQAGVFSDCPEGSLQPACELAFNNFKQHDTTQLDDDKLDEWSREIWKNMTLRQKLWKGAQPLAMVTAPFLAVILIPFDAGGSAVLVFASAKELLAAAGLAALLPPIGSGNEVLDIVHRETPWRQLCNLFALLCDSLGFPRPSGPQLPRIEFATTGGRVDSRQLVTSDIPIQRSISPPVAIWQPEPELAAALRRLAERIDP
ncbi:MAG TPA: hypothetical protein DDW52_09985 [Planctomycetaceae bacterium]|nr:hypothetical protein [Planctomycetaceae bacterium]